MADSSGSRLSVLEKLLVVGAALLALGTAFLGYKSATISEARNQAEVVAADTNNELTSLQEEYEKLQAENTRLREQLGLPGPTTDSQDPATSATVRRGGQLTLAASRSADLDSPSDPQWDDGFLDISYSGNSGSIDIYSGAVSMLYLADEEADYETCRNTTGYSSESIGTVAGAYFCVRTNENRYSAVRIDQFDSSRITLDVVTYDPPDD